jgi:hypothetical protein
MKLNKILKKFKNEEIKRKLGQMRNIFSYACNVVKKYTHELDSNSYVGPKFYWMVKCFSILKF